MRPVDKGVAPARYVRYQDANSDLRGRIGDYCSYCERQIETHLAVEHVQPKVRRTTLRNSWSNFLLGCVNCNSSKGKNVWLFKITFGRTETTPYARWNTLMEDWCDPMLTLSLMIKSGPETRLH